VLEDVSLPVGGPVHLLVVYLKGQLERVLDDEEEAEQEDGELEDEVDEHGDKHFVVEPHEVAFALQP